ncbi:hypothetical protein SAMN04488238_105208 [Roseicitreum antarcticum]|uniref:Uncharacterized protein n=1 Tax=Roseicitreum antarcticum TaxID=564137 RepID=A0A1H2Z0S5_9RHOB|nr:hypothetical protein SAMN04488238_105208 [Roseicitreum antarcticum]
MVRGRRESVVETPCDGRGNRFDALHGWKFWPIINNRISSKQGRNRVWFVAIEVKAISMNYISDVRFIEQVLQAIGGGQVMFLLLQSARFLRKNKKRAPG